MSSMFASRLLLPTALLLPACAGTSSQPSSTDASPPAEQGDPGAAPTNEAAPEVERVTGIGPCDFFLYRYAECVEALPPEKQKTGRAGLAMLREYYLTPGRDPEQTEIECYVALEAQRRNEPSPGCGWQDAPRVPAELVQAVEEEAARQQGEAQARLGERAMAQDPPLSRSSLEVEGLDADIMSRIFDAHGREIVRCYQQAVQGGRALPAKLHLSWELAAKGSVEAVEISPSELATEPLGKCIEAAARRIEVFRGHEASKTADSGKAGRRAFSSMTRHF